MKELKFSYNWNMKLNCNAFTTLRLTDKYKINETVKVTLKDNNFFVMIIDKKQFYLKDINNFISYIDTGYDKEECKKILQRMYKNKNVDWNTQKIYFYLIKKINMKSVE